MDDTEGELVAKKLQELEELLLNSGIRKNKEIVSDLLSDDFIEFGSSGCIFTKEKILCELVNEPVSSITLEKFQSIPVAPEVFLVTYRAVRSDPASGLSATSLRSSLWVMRNAKWQILFHQGTKSIDADACS